MGIFSDEREVEKCVGEVLVGQGGIGKHAGAGMAFSDGTGTFLVILEAQHIGISQIGGWRIELRNKFGRVRFQSWRTIQISIDPMAVVAGALTIKDIPSSQNIAFWLSTRLR